MADDTQKRLDAINKQRVELDREMAECRRELAALNRELIEIEQERATTAAPSSGGDGQARGATVGTQAGRSAEPRQEPPRQSQTRQSASKDRGRR